MVSLCASVLVVVGSAQAEPGTMQAAPGQAAPGQLALVIDSVAASVDGKPITLRDISERIGATRTLSLQEASSNTQAQQVLEGLIMERLVEEEAAARNISISDSEVDRYIGQVAQRNQMTREEFESALRIHQKNVDDYRQQVRAEIARSRLMGQLAQQGAAVTQEDIDQYLREHPALTKSGSKVKLRQIVIGLNQRTPEEAQARAAEALDKISSGVPFEDVAREYSESPEAADGGSLGMVAEEDLNPELFETLLALPEGGVSQVLSLPNSLRLFKVEERYLDKDQEANEKMLAEVRRTLSEQKLQERMQTFFTSDLTKLHFVDRKL